MIYLELFITFFKIGLFSFGGGHAMIPMIMDEICSKGWMSMEELKQLIAVSESTPGPFAINIATFIGATNADISILGAFISTLGVILPSFIIILIIASLLTNFTKYKSIKKIMSTIRPVIIGLIIAAGINILLTNIFPNYPNFSSESFIFDSAQLALFIALLTFKVCFSKKLTPVPLILIAAILGVLIFGV